MFTPVPVIAASLVTAAFLVVIGISTRRASRGDQ
jgi:hypothetical protein